MSNHCIAVVEDDQAILDIVELILVDEGYQVITAANELDLNSMPNRPDLIVLDNWLGRTSGHDICVNLKQNPETADIPVILMSAGNNLDQIADSCHADLYINKPFDIDEFVQSINTLITARSTNLE